MLKNKKAILLIGLLLSLLFVGVDYFLFNMYYEKFYLIHQFFAILLGGILIRLSLKNFNLKRISEYNLLILLVSLSLIIIHVIKIIMPCQI